MLGYAPEERPHAYGRWKQLFHEAELEQMEEILRQAMLGQEGFEVEHRIRARDGQWRWVLTRGKVIHSESSACHTRVVGTHSDITERKRAEEELRRAKEAAEAANSALRLNMAHLRTLLTTIPDLIWLKDVDGVYIFCNPRFERFFGAPEHEIVGRKDTDFMPPEHAEHFRKHDKAAMKAGKPTVNEETITYKDDGHVEDLETVKTPMYDDRGQLIGVLGVARDITERNRMTEELRESELRFKALHNASFGGIAIHEKGLILDCNQGLADITGYTLDELIGMDGLLLIAEQSRGQVMENILAGYEKPYESVGLRRDGEEYPVRLEARNIPYKGRQVRVVEFRDISERKRAETGLRDSEQRHRVIFENSPLAMIRFSTEGVILDCNDNFVNMMGSTREKLIGFDSLRRTNPKMQETLARALAGQPSSYEDYYTSVTGNRTAFLHAQFNPVNVGKSPTEVIATLEDFSDRKAAQDELRKAKEQAEEYSRSKTEFLTNMSHEIRTPLNGILGMLQLMQTTGLNEEQSEYVLAALSSSKRLMNLLTDILDLSRVEAGKLVVQHTPFDLPDTCRQVCELFRLTSDQTGVALDCVLDDSLPRLVEGDALRLQQVLTNLLGNAFKFTSRGRILLTAHTMPDPDPDHLRVLFSVSDTGVGIPDSELGTLFEAFTQVSQGYTRTHQGAGLGLAICKRLVDLMGGNMAIESEEGRGTVLYVSIPFGKVDGQREEIAVQQPEPVVPGGRLRILLAEDERVNSLVTQRILEKDGHSVLAVENGREVIEALQREPFDVVLMDIQMPVMDGMAATRAIRKGEVGADRVNVPILAVTAYAMVGDREKFLGAGMDGYLIKPLEAERLRAALAQTGGTGRD